MKIAPNVTCWSTFGQMIIIPLFVISCASEPFTDTNHRHEISLKTNWKFSRVDNLNSKARDFDDRLWEEVSVPHDWAIYGPYDESLDKSVIKVLEDGERIPKLRRGRTGALPYQGVGWYRRTIDITLSAKGRKLFIEFDGAMSHSEVYFNGKYVGGWPYGYTSFSLDLTEHMELGTENVLAVRLENPSFLSRWYPGAGLYRNVRLVYTDKTHVAHWGTYVTTPSISKTEGTVRVETKVEGLTERNTELLTAIYSPDGKIVATDLVIVDEADIEQHLVVASPLRWDVESPHMYTILSKVIVDSQVVDVYSSTFGFRTIQFTADDGFYLNERRLQLKGVCLHHDLGPLGAAVNTTALHRQLRIMKDMGANAIRTSHNPPTPELLSICDTMGLLVIDELFDEWKVKKVDGGYHHLWDEWAEKDLVALIHRDRNHPSVIAWSMGNEIREQKSDNGWKRAKFLVDIAHREDSTRPTTIGMNADQAVIQNGFAAQFDVQGWNYHMDMIPKVKEIKPEWSIYASESQSTISSRGYYDLNAQPKKHPERNNLLTSAYALDYCNWCNTADEGFATIEDNPFAVGEFVWTGFDYIGEPTPYQVQWPTRSSHFGLADLVGIPKDIYYQYKAHWSEEDVLHILPHWNWAEGENVPIHVFTSFDRVELFVNGESKGVRIKDKLDTYGRYRLRWDSVRYEPGEAKVVALDEGNNVLMERVIKTAGEPYAIKLIPEETELTADGESLGYVEVQVVDEHGNLCPNADDLISFHVDGVGSFRAAGNGDPRDTTLFHLPVRKAFFGKCMVILQSSTEKGEIEIVAKSDGLFSEKGSIKVE